MTPALALGWRLTLRTRARVPALARLPVRRAPAVLTSLYTFVGRFQNAARPRLWT